MSKSTMMQHLKKKKGYYPIAEVLQKELFDKDTCLKRVDILSTYSVFWRLYPFLIFWTRTVDVASKLLIWCNSTQTRKNRKKEKSFSASSTWNARRFPWQ